MGYLPDVPMTRKSGNLEDWQPRKESCEAMKPNGTLWEKEVGADVIRLKVRDAFN